MKTDDEAKIGKRLKYSNDGSTETVYLFFFKKKTRATKKLQYVKHARIKLDNNGNVIYNDDDNVEKVNDKKSVHFSVTAQEKKLFYGNSERKLKKYNNNNLTTTKRG